LTGGKLSVIIPLMIYSYELEQHILAGLIKLPGVYAEIAPIISEGDFYNENSHVHQTIFKVLRMALENGDQIDEIILAQRILDLNISFEDNLDITSFVQKLGMRKINQSGLINAVKDLKKITVRREIFKSAQRVAKKMKNMGSSHTFDEIIEEADSIYNKQIDFYSMDRTSPENIYSDMEAVVEERGNNPIDEFGFMGPHPRLNELYGSLLRPGNISVIVARSGVGKTTFCLDFISKVSLQHDNIPVLHFDNGEMSKEELLNRQCAALSGVPLGLLETGKWRRNQECVDKVRAVWPKIKKFKLYYYNVAGMDIPSMLNVIKRFYYSNNVKRNNPMIFSFDYIKTVSSMRNKGNNEWEVVGDMITAFKNLIQKEILGEDGPVIAMITSVQSNRSGVTNNRRVENIVRDESIVSLSDRIIQFCSHMFHLRPKLAEEIQAENSQFGTHILEPFKYRHLGQDVSRALNLVEKDDGTKVRNHLNLEINNFNIEEVGDLQDQVNAMDLTAEADEDGDQLAINL
jgi:replicative DNA helicase